MDNKILLVDDSKLARKICVKALNNGGFDNIFQAVNASETREIFDREKPDLVILDITLPDNFDLTLLKELLEKDPTIKIIIVSAIGQELIVRDAITIGAKKFIVKPYDEKELLQAVCMVLSGD